MFVANLDNQEVRLISLDEALDQTGLSVADLERFKGGHFPTHPLWSDDTVTNRLLENLTKAIPIHWDASRLPELPDQLASLLRTELTLLSGTYDLSADEKDVFEQQLQNVLRPMVYAIIEAKVASKQLEEVDAQVGRLMGETITPSWQSYEVEGWLIQELDSVFGPIGFSFKNGGEITYAQAALSAESHFFLEMGRRFLSKLCHLPS